METQYYPQAPQIDTLLALSYRKTIILVRQIAQRLNESSAMLQ